MQARHANILTFGGILSFPKSFQREFKEFSEEHALLISLWKLQKKKFGTSNTKSTFFFHFPNSSILLMNRPQSDFEDFSHSYGVEESLNKISIPIIFVIDDTTNFDSFHAHLIIPMIVF